MRIKAVWTSFLPALLLMFCVSCASKTQQAEKVEQELSAAEVARNNAVYRQWEVETEEKTDDQVNTAAVEQSTPGPGSEKTAALNKVMQEAMQAERQRLRMLAAKLEKEKSRKVSARKMPVNYKVYHYMPDTYKSVGSEILLSEISKEIAGKVFYQLKEEGQKIFTSNVAVVAAVPLADFKKETEFGRMISEYLLTDLADRGLRVTELRLGKEINILPQTGEFIMSRNIGELANNAPELDYVVISTFTNTRKTLILQGRLVSLKTGIVKTSWRHSLPLNRELMALFHTAEKPLKIAVKGMRK